MKGTMQQRRTWRRRRTRHARALRGGEILRTYDGYFYGKIRWVRGRSGSQIYAHSEHRSPSGHSGMAYINGVLTQVLP